MSSFTRTLTLAKDGTYSKQTSENIHCHKGVIHRIQLMFPPGCNALANVALYHGQHPIAPSTEGQFFQGDDETIDFKEHYELGSENNIVTVSGYNADDTYEHKVYVRIFVLPKWVVTFVGAYEGIIGSIKNIIVRTKTPEGF